MLSAVVSPSGRLVGLAFSLALLFCPRWSRSPATPEHAADLPGQPFFGWTFIGWVVSLVWACTRQAAGRSLRADVSHGSCSTPSSGGCEIRRIYPSPCIAVPRGEG